MLKFLGAAYFRQRIALSILSGKSISIKEIRSNEENPGLKGILTDGT
jgi:RNA 3'-terminal phosphate cyclase